MNMLMNARTIGRFYRRWVTTRRHPEPDPDWTLRRASKLIRRKTYCLVVTGSEHLTARVVEPFKPDDEGRIIFGTDPESRKAEHIRGTGRCLLVYQDDRRRAYVSVECDATVLSPEESTRFMPWWRAFWPNGPDHSFVNVVCTPTTVEIWDGLAVIGRDREHVHLASRGKERVQLSEEQRL